MVESVLVITNFLMVGSILLYFYFREIRHKNDENLRNESLQQFYKDANNTRDQLLKDITKSKDETFKKTFEDFLKHIQKLELMVLPKPVTRNMVQEVLDRSPLEVENDIEKSDVEINQENFMDVLSKIPITDKTKVAFESEVNDIEMPEEIIK